VIDANLSHLSDLAFEGAMAGYLVALVCHAIEAASRRARQPLKQAAMAGAAGPDSITGGAGEQRHP
jgi:hypothetical protein